MQKKQLIEELVSISSWAGADEDFVQAGGGNTSVKFENTMFIKASGFKLSEVTENKGYVEVDINKIIELIDNHKKYEIYEAKERDKIIIKEVQKTVIRDNGFRPSVEAFLHALFGKTVIHTHPILINAICCVDNCQKILENLFFDDVLYIPYSEPGYPLACLMKTEVDIFFENKGFLPEIVFLGNHGLFISGNSVDDSISRMNYVITKIEKFFNIDKSKNQLKTIFKENTSVSLDKWYDLYKKYVNNAYLKVIKNENPSTIELIKCQALYPDYVVYCGKNYLSIDSVEISGSVEKDFRLFFTKNGNVPSVIYCNDGNIIFMGNNSLHVENISSVFIAHAKTVLLGQRIGKLIPLNEDEIAYIDNWESEKYRKNLIV